MPDAKFLLAAVLACTAVLSGCTDPDPAQAGTADQDPTGEPTTTDSVAAEADTVFPGQDWETVDAAEAGLDQGVLDELAATAETGRSNCLVVTRGGKLVDEWYWSGTDADTSQEVFSATKSFTSVLMGMAADDGDLGVSDTASTWIPQWQGTPSQDVTVEQLLSNTSGRFQDFETDYVEMAAQAPDKTAFAIRSRPAVRARYDLGVQQLGDPDAGTGLQRSDRRGPRPTSHNSACSSLSG